MRERVNHRHHHGGDGNVVDPDGQEHGDEHDSKHEPASSRTRMAPGCNSRAVFLATHVYDVLYRQLFYNDELLSF